MVQMHRQELECLQQAVEEASEQERVVQAWAEPRHLAAHYGRLVRALDDLARKRNTAARLAKGTVPRWFAVLPCDRPFEVWETRRDHWGDTLGRTLLVETERLSWEHTYPLERRLIALVQRELGEGRRVMLYIDQNDLRSTPRRLEWVLKDVQPWTLPNSVAAEDRQQAILQAVQQGHHVVIVPYRRVNEGLNLQSGIDTILWVEMALNLFMLDQASRRAWRLGKCEEVRIYYLAYANTAGHTKLRKLGQQSGAAAAFAGEPARGALIEHAGADKTTLARLSSLLEQSEGEGETRRTPCCNSPVRKRWPRKRRCSRPCLPNVRRNCARRWCEGVSGLAGSRTISQNALQPSRPAQLPGFRCGPSVLSRLLSQSPGRPVRQNKSAWSYQSARTNGSVSQ